MQAIEKCKEYCHCNFARFKNGKCDNCFKPLNPLATELSIERLKAMKKSNYKIYEIFQEN